MSIGDFFKGLVLDVWYKALVYIGGIVLVLSFFLDVKGISNTDLQLLAGGIFFFGLGQWMDHHKDFYYKPPNAYSGPGMQIEQTVWRPRLFGVVFDLLGIVLFVIGLRNAFR